MNTIKSLNRFVKWVLWAALLATLAGCATRPLRVPLTSEAAAKLHKIALVDVQEPTEYGAVNVANEFRAPLLNFQHSQQFTSALQERGFGLSAEFNERLVDALKAAGFDVERIHRIRKGDAVTHTDTNADAILIVFVGAGYKGNDFSNYIPYMQAQAILRENKSGKETQIYREHFWYGSMNPLIGGILIESPPKYSYGTFGNLMANVGEAGDGLLEAAGPISGRLVNEITPKNH